MRFFFFIGAGLEESWNIMKVDQKYTCIFIFFCQIPFCIIPSPPVRGWLSNIDFLTFRGGWIMVAKSLSLPHQDLLPSPHPHPDSPVGGNGNNSCSLQIQSARELAACASSLLRTQPLCCEKPKPQDKALGWCSLPGLPGDIQHQLLVLWVSGVFSISSQLHPSWGQPQLTSNGAEEPVSWTQSAHRLVS